MKTVMLYEALQKAKENGADSAFWGKANPKCPHCGEYYSIAEQQAEHLYDKEDGERVELKCYHCGGSFYTEVYIDIVFHTDNADELEEEENI